jgi:hypothetical protein
LRRNVFASPVRFTHCQNGAPFQEKGGRNATSPTGTRKRDAQNQQWSTARFMRVLSIQQPWAHLVIRGVKLLEHRSWPSTHTGRIAVHASTNLELKAVERMWDENSAVARCFAEQGWRDRDDLKALPRSAILGSVELLGVHRAAAVRAAKVDSSGKDWITDALETAVRDPYTGHLRPAQRSARTLPVPIPDTGYMWAFARALEVEPILDVPGQQHLWHLPVHVATVLAEREAASRRGEWTPPIVSRERRRASLDAWRAKFENEIAREAWRLQGEAVREMQIAVMEFDDAQTERTFKSMLRKYVAEHGVEGPRRKPHVRIQKRLRGLFDGKEMMSVLDFELELRHLIHEKMETEKVATLGLARHKKVLALLTELRAEAEQRPVAKEQIERDVKQLFKRLMNEQFQRDEAEPQWGDLRDYE